MFKRFVFTLSLLLIVLTFGIYNQTHLGPISATTQLEYGHAPAHAMRGDWLRLFTSLVLTGDQWHLMTAIVMITVCVGWLEWLTGPIATLLIFASSHVVTLLVSAVGLIAIDWAIGDQVTRRLVIATDIGPSAGYYGCLGCALFTCDFRWRGWIVTVITAILVFRLGASFAQRPIVSSQLQSDLAHLIALGLGTQLAYFSRNSRLCTSAKMRLFTP